VKKMPCVFQRDFKDDHTALARDEVTPGCEWVLAGEGVATVKWDGTATMVRDGKIYARFDAKRGKAPPLGFEPCQEPDPVTGHWPGWIPAEGPAYRWIRAAFDNFVNTFGVPPVNGTYEACGPKIGSNPHKLDEHQLIRHGRDVVGEEREGWTFTAIRDLLTGRDDWEGLVFHHPDGRMAKIHRTAFGLPWGAKKRKS
jgi:hypothetical protein